MGPPLAISTEPELVKAEPESLTLKWQLPNWQGSPVTHILVQRSLLGQCGLEDVDWNFEYEPIPIDFSEYINSPQPHYISTFLDGLQSDTKYLFRAKTQIL